MNRMRIHALSLYYCGLNTGNEAYSRFHAARLPAELQLKLKEESFKAVDAVDLEVNYKSNNSISRSNPTYFRAGVETKLGYQLSLYQSVSTYRQTIDLAVTKQPEYFALLNWSATSHLSLGVAYHYLNTDVDGYKIPANLLYASVSTKLSRFSLGLNGSFLSTGSGNYRQFGGSAGVVLTREA